MGIKIPLFGTYSTRAGDTSKDQRFKNVFLEKIEAPRIQGREEGLGEHIFSVIKRPGMSDAFDTTNVAAGRGMYTWKSNIYSVMGDRIYKGTTEITALGNRLAGTTGRVYFAEEHKVDLLVLKAGDKIWTITAGDVVTLQTDADIPTGLVGGIVNMDTYIFVMNGDGEIYNSDVDDVTAWTAGSFITSKIEPDDGICITKWQNHILALNAWSTEFFYDAANASGSPLSPSEGTLTDVGCASAATVFSNDDVVVWLGVSHTGGLRVMVYDGSSVNSFENDALSRILDQEETTIANSYAFGMRVAGHLFYVLTLPATKAITLILDIEQNMWCEWNSDNGTTETYFTGVDYASLNGKHYIQDEDNGKIYMMDFDIYQDSGNDINVEIVTNRYDFGTNLAKFMSRLTVIGDEQTSTSSLSIEYTDDDYQTYSTARTVDMSHSVPFLSRLGSFIRRAFRLKHTANTALRLESLDADVEGGGLRGGNI